MVFENVVVAYDGSGQALAAVKKAAEIVGGEEAAKLHVVFVTRELQQCFVRSSAVPAFR